MILLKFKEPCISGWQYALTVLKKNELKKILSYYNYKLSSKATKDEYVYHIVDTVKTETKRCLSQMPWESLEILLMLCNAEPGAFVKRPAKVTLAAEELGLIFAYRAKGSLIEWITMPTDVRDILKPEIIGIMHDRVAQLHRVLDPYILGMMNLYGACPEQLLMDTLRRFGKMGKVDGFPVDEDVVRKLATAFALNAKLIGVSPGSIPAPYEDSETVVKYYISPYVKAADYDEKDLIKWLQGDGLLHKTYRTFTEEEILAAGKSCPEFLWPEAKAMKELLLSEGYDEVAAQAQIIEYWLSHQFDDDTNKKRYMHFASKGQQKLYDALIEVQPMWVAHGYNDRGIEGEFDAAKAKIDDFIDKKQKELDNAIANPITELLPCFTRHPAIKPAEGNDMAYRFVGTSILEVTVDAEDGEYFVCYLTRSDEGKMEVVASWENVFDYLKDIKLMYKKLIELTKGFERKYPKISQQMYENNKDRNGHACLGYARVTGFKVQWVQFIRLDFDKWDSILFSGPLQFPEVVDTINMLYDAALDIREEIENSDSKKFHARLNEFLQS